MNMGQGIYKTKPTRQTWDRVLSGDVTAYQVVVEANQSAVSAVAYSIIGDFSTSQDIAQETFWVAWTKRNSLRDVGRLSAWLCGIARNLAKQWRKKHKRRAATREIVPGQEPAVTSDLIDQSIAEEEQQLVWSALEEIPENYREVLTLYYRQGQSIAEVAISLEISEEAARQRLSRGRTLLRGRVSGLIEGVLTRSTPGASFTARVMAGLAGAGMVAKTGSAAASSIPAVGIKSATMAAATAKGVLASGATVGLLGGILGSIGGLGGAYLGTWLPAQLARTETERQLMMQQGRIVFGICILYTVAILILSLAFAFIRFPVLWFFLGMVSISIPFMIGLTIMTIRLARMCTKLRQEMADVDDDPNQSPLARFGTNKIRKGRSWRTDLELFGYPLIDIQFGDADFAGNPIDMDSRRHARGWLALGDVATGIIAIGGFARGLVALGGLAIGLLSFGGLALGGMAVGGGAVGFLAVGGGAVGYNAAGGGAIGWHSAAGGGAVAWHAAFGGGALARDFAVGGGALANEANTALAREVIERETMKPLVESLSFTNPFFIVGMLLITVFPVFMMKWIYTEDEIGEVAKPKS